MKRKTMKQRAITFLSCSLVVAMTMSLPFASTTVLAANVVPAVTVRGDTAGFKVIDANLNTPLVNVNGMYPGESTESVLRVENADVVPFTLTMELHNIAQTPPTASPLPDGTAPINLANVLNVKITKVADGEVLFNAPLVNAKGEEQPIELGAFAINTATDLQFTLELDGVKTDNHYQGAVAQFSVTLNAVSTGVVVDGPPPPGPGRDRQPNQPENTEEGDGGDGGDTTTTLPADAQPLAAATIPDTVTLDETATPLGTVEFATPEDLVELMNEDTPLGTEILKKMPKTGEVSLMVYTLLGLGMVAIGVIMLRPAKAKRKH